MSRPYFGKYKNWAYLRDQGVERKCGEATDYLCSNAAKTARFNMI
jgi:hypothetical protein